MSAVGNISIASNFSNKGHDDDDVLNYHNIPENINDALDS